MIQTFSQQMKCFDLNVYFDFSSFKLHTILCGKFNNEITF